MAYTNFTNCTKEQYETIIYSGGSKNKIKIWFNNIELENADYYCEKLSVKSRVIPDDGSKRFSLDNFLAKELELIMHNINLENIVDQVRISIGTLVDKTNNIYEYVPIGIFNIQDTPKTDKDKITIKLRDNAVKFDVSYDGKTLIDLNDGSATKMQILNDICTQVGVISDVSSFLGSSDLIGTYDNTINARVYISYLAEQAGCIAYITRQGHLQFVDFSNLAIQEIPLNIVEKYEIGEPYTIERIVYEDAIRKYETSSDDTLSTLFINSANPYMVDSARLITMLSNFNNFEIDSLTTGKILGNPAIDPFDIIQIYGYYQEDQYGRKIFVPDKNIIVAKTLANNNFTYKGVMTSDFSTKIGTEARKENVTINSGAAFQKYAKTMIDEVEGKVTIMAGQVDEQGSNIKTVQFELTNQQAKIDVISTNIDETGDVTSVKTSKGYTFDDEGLKIGSGEDEFNSLTNNTGTYYKDGSVTLSQFTKDNSIVKDLVLYGKYYYGVEEELIVENFTKDDAMFVAEKFTTDNNEECFGHFVNSN